MSNGGLSAHPLRKGILIVRSTKPAADRRASSFLIETWAKLTMTFISQQHNSSLGDKARSYLDSVTACMSLHVKLYHSHAVCIHLTPQTHAKVNLYYAAVTKTSTVIATSCAVAKVDSSATTSGKHYRDFSFASSWIHLDLGTSPLRLH